MRFKLDENLPLHVAEYLRSLGYDALTTGEQGLNGVADPGVAAVCKVEQRVILTLDKDFGDVRIYPPQNYAGIILLRPRRQAIPVLVNMVARIVPMFANEPLQGNLWSVDETRVRVTPG